MSLELVLSSRFQSTDNRKREAVRAAHDQDIDTLLELTNHYLTLKSARKAQTSEATRRLYAVAIARFLEYCAGQNSQRLELTRLESDDIELWLVGLQASGIKPSSIGTYLNGVRTLYRALVWAKATAHNPAAEVKAPKDPTPAHLKKSALSPGLYRELVKASSEKYDPDDPRRSRDALLLALGGSGGLRAKEIVGLNTTDIELPLKRLIVQSGKGGKRRVIPLSSELLNLLKHWLEVRKSLEILGEIPDTESALLVSISRNQSHGRRLTTDGARFIAKGYYLAAGLPSEMFGLHTLRRTAGTHLYRATRDLHVVADVLGHASVNTSAIYAKMDMDVRREALEKMEQMRDELE
ncbi:MAG: tyrosine-type recombinase/integrase [Deinococcales bacterium]